MNTHDKPPFEEVMTDPLVVLGRVDYPSVAAPLTDRLAVDHPGTRFIAVISALDTDDEGALFEGIRPHVAELVFTASADEHAATPDVLASQALDSYGFGQDFVFQVPHLGDAIDYALEALSGDGQTWEGTALLVVGAQASIVEARAHLEARGLVQPAG